MARRRRICPRCGLTISWVEKRKIGKRIYYYAIHEYNIGGKTERKACYLGPEQYKYVTATHADEGIAFYGLIKKERELEYLYQLLEVITQKIESKELKTEEVKVLRERLLKLIEMIDTNYK